MDDTDENNPGPPSVPCRTDSSDSDEVILLSLEDDDSTEPTQDGAQQSPQPQPADDSELEIMESEEEEEEEEITIIEISDTEIKDEPEDDYNNIEEGCSDFDPGKLGVIVTETELPDDLLGEPIKGVYRCKFCPQKFQVKTRLIAHIERHISNGSIRKCRFCEFFSAVTQTLREHEWKHTREKPYHCDMCNFCCRLKGDLARHQLVHSSYKRYECKVCNHRTKTAGNLRKHMERHEPDLPRNFPCSLCGFAFKRDSALKSHMSRRHNDAKPFFCEQCAFRCKTMWELNSHKAKHSNEHPYRCTWADCNKRFKTKSDCTKHAKRHLGVKNYMCSICGKRFFNSTLLRKHAPAHSDVRNFECGECSKKFKTLRALQSHMLVHQAIKPFQCDVCYKTFGTQFNLDAHKRVHAGGRPYQCPICMHGSREMDHLMAHVGAEHLHNFTYLCGLCRKPFGKSFQLQLHMQRCHKENMEGQEEAMVYDPDYLGFDLQPEPSGLFDASLFAKYLARETMGSLGGAQPTGSTRLVKLEPGMAGTSDDSGVCSDPTNSPENGSGVSEPLQLPPVVQLARYGGIPFCLARKNSGIQLNCQKKGKKPNRWFMDISLMTAEDAERHREYLRRKENGLLQQKRRRKKAGKRITKGRSRTSAWQPKPSTSGLKGGKVKAKRPQKHRRVTWDNKEEDTDEEEAYRLAQELMVKLEKQNVSDSGKAKPQRVSGRSKKKASSLKMLPSSASTLLHKTVSVKTSSSSAGMAAGTATQAVDHSEAGMPAKRRASTSDCSGSKAASLRRRSKSVMKKKPSQSGKKVLKKLAAGKNTGVQTLARKKKLSGVSSLLYVNVKEEPREVRNAPASALSPFAVSHYNTTVAATNTQCWLNALLAGAARGCHGNALVDGGTKAASAALVRGTHFDDLKEEFFVKGLQLKERRHRDGVNENGVVLSTTSSSITIPPQGETLFLDDPNVHVTSEGKDSNVKTDSVVSAVNLQGFGQVLAPAAEGASDSDIWQATTECLLGVLEAVSAEQLQVHGHPAVLTMPCKDLEFNDGDTVEENVSLPPHGVTGDSKANGPLLPQPTVVEEDMEVEDRYHSVEELVPRHSRASSQSLDPTESSQGTRRFHFAADVEVDKDRVTPQEVQQPQAWSVSKEGGSTAQSRSVKNPSSCKLQKSSFDPFLSMEEDSEGISMSETLCEAEKNICEEQSLESSFALPEIVENITEVNYSERELLSDVDAANTSSAALQESEDMLQSEEISPSESVSAEMQLETNMTESGTTLSEVSAPPLSQTEDSCQGQHNTAELLPKETITNCSSDRVQEGSTSLSQNVGNRQGGSTSAYSLSRKKTRSSGMKDDGLSKTAESVQEERLPTESPPADDTPSTCSVGVKDAAAQNSLDGAMLTKSHPVTSTKTGTSELQQLVESSQEEAVKEGQCEPLPSRNDGEEHFESPLASLQSDLENKTKPVPGMNEPAAVCDSLSERVQTRSSGMLEKWGNQERVRDLSKCLHVLVADIRTNPLALNSLQRFGVSTTYLDVSPAAAQRNTEGPPKRESGKKNKQATAKPKVSPRKASRVAKSPPKKKSRASRVTGKGADAASSSSASGVDAENANATGIGGLLLATATVAKQGGSPAKTSPKIKEQTGKGKALASKASTQKKSKRKPRKVGRPRKRAGNRIAKDVGHDKVLEHDEEHCRVEGQHFVEGSSPVEGHSHADSHIDEHSHDEGHGHVEGQGHVDEYSHIDEHSHVEGHVDEHSHIDGQGHVKGRGHVNKHSHTDGHSHVEGHSHVDEHIHIARHSHVEGQGHVDEHSHIDGHSHVEGHSHVDEQSHIDGHSHVEGHSHVDEQSHIARYSHVDGHSHIDRHSHVEMHSHVDEHSHVDGHCPVEGHSHVEGHSPVEGMMDELVEGASSSPIAIKLELDEPATDERFLMVGVVDYESTAMTIDNCTTNSQESTGADSLTANDSKTLTSRGLTANNRKSVGNKILPIRDPEIDKQHADKGSSTTKPPRTKTAKKSRRSASKETVAATSPKPKQSRKPAHISGMDTDIEEAQACPETTDNGGDLPAEPSTAGRSDKGKLALDTPPTRIVPSAAVASPRKSERARKVRQPVTHPHSTEVIENIKTLLHNKPGAKLPAGLKRLGILTSYQQASAKKEVVQPSVAKRLPGNSAALRSSTKMVEDPPMQHDKAAATASVSEKKAASATGEEARDRVGMEPMSLDSTEDASLQPSLMESETQRDHLRLPEQLDPSADDGGKDQLQKAVAASEELCHISPEMPRAEGNSDTSSEMEGNVCEEPVSSPADRELALTEEGASRKRDSSVTDSEFRLAEGDVNGKPDSPVTDSEFRLAEGDVNGKPDSPVTDSEFRLAEGDVKEKPDSPVIANEFRLAEGDVNGKPVSPVADREFRLTEVSVNEEPDSASDSKLGPTEVGVNEKQVSVLDSGPGLTESASEEPVLSTVDRGLWLVEGGINKEPVSSVDHGFGLAEEVPVSSAVDCGLALAEGGANEGPVSSAVGRGLGLAEGGANEGPVSSAVDRGLGLAEGGANEGPVSSAVGRGLGLAEGGANEGPVSSAVDCGLGLAEGGANEGPVSSAVDCGLGLAEGVANEVPVSSAVGRGLGLAEGGANEGPVSSAVGCGLGLAEEGANEVPVSCAADRGLGLAEGGVTVSEEPVPVLDCGLGLAESDGNKEPVFSAINSGLGLAERSANEEPTSSVTGNDLGLAAGGESKELVPVLDQDLGLAEGVNEEPVSSVFDPGLGVAEEGANKEPVSYVLGLGPADGDVNEEPVSSVLDHGLRLTRGGVNTEPVSVLDQGLGLAEGSAVDEPVPSVLGQGLGLAEGGALDKPVPSVLGQGLGVAEGGATDEPVLSVLDQRLGLAEGGALDKPVPSVLEQGLGLAEGGATDEPVLSVLDQGLGLAEGGVSKEAVSVLGQGLGLVEGSVNEEPVSSVLDCGAELAERGMDQDTSSSAVDHSRDASPEKSTGNMVTVAQRKVFSVEIQAAIRKANTGQAESSPASDGCAVSPLPSERHARFSGRTLRNKSSVSGSSHHQQNPVLSDETPADTAIVAPPADVTSESFPRNKVRKVFRKQKGKSKVLKRLNAKRKFSARGNVNDTEKRARSGTAGRGENKAHHQLWAKIKQAQAGSTKRTAKSAMKQTVQTAAAAEIATETAVKKSKNSAFKIIKPCGKTSSRAHKEPGMGVSRKRKRFMYVETDMGESPDPPCKKRGRPPGPKIILDRSQANLCFEPAQLLPGPGPVDAGLVDEASFGAEVPSWLLTQAGTLAPSFAEGGLCIVPSQSNPLIYTVLPPPSAQSPPPGDAAAVPESSEAHQLQISISAPEEYAALQLNDLEMPDVKPVLSQLSESALPDVKPLIDELKHMNSSSPPQLLNETQVSGATGLMWNELPLPAESSKSQEDLGHLDEAGAAQVEASTSGPAESECSAPGKSQHVQSTLTSQHQRLRHVVGKRHKIRRRKKKDRLFSAQVRYKEAVGVSYDGDRRRSRRPKKSRLTDEEMRMAQDSPTSDLESEERALTSERSQPLDGNDEDAGSDIEFVSADYSHVDFSAQRLFLENLRVETFPFGELGDGQEAMEMFSQGEISELDTVGEQGDLDMAGEASNSREFVTDEVGFGEMMSCPEFDDSPEEGGILDMESGPQADMELAASNEKLELVEAAGFGIEAHVPRVPCVKAEDSLVGQVYPNLDGIEEIGEPLTDIEAMQSDVMKRPPWAHAEECTLKTEETEEYPAGSRCNCMDSESDCESKYRTTDHCLAVRGAHPIIKEEVKAELSSEIATQCISPELPHPQLQAFTPGSKCDEGHEVSVMENIEAGCAQSLKHEADVSDISMGMLVPDTPLSSQMHVPVGLGTALEGSPSLTIFVKTSEGRGVLIQDDPKNVIKDELAQNN